MKKKKKNANGDMNLGSHRIQKIIVYLKVLSQICACFGVGLGLKNQILKRSFYETGLLNYAQYYSKYLHSLRKLSPSKFQKKHVFYGWYIF